MAKGNGYETMLNKLESAGDFFYDAYLKLWNLLSGCNGYDEQGCKIREYTYNLLRDKYPDSAANMVCRLFSIKSRKWVEEVYKNLHENLALKRKEEEENKLLFENDNGIPDSLLNDPKIEDSAIKEIAELLSRYCDNILRGHVPKATISQTIHIPEEESPGQIYPLEVNHKSQEEMFVKFPGDFINKIFEEFNEPSKERNDYCI